MTEVIPGTSVLSRGTGDGQAVPSPRDEQVFGLATGRCLDDPAVRVATFGVRRSGPPVEVARP